MTVTFSTLFGPRHPFFGHLMDILTDGRGTYCVRFYGKSLEEPIIETSHRCEWVAVKQAKRQLAQLLGVA